MFTVATKWALSQFYYIVTLNQNIDPLLQNRNAAYIYLIPSLYNFVLFFDEMNRWEIAAEQMLKFRKTEITEKGSVGFKRQSLLWLTTELQQWFILV